MVHRFFVAENKTFAGREMRAEGEAMGRTLSIAWFEKFAECAQGICSQNFKVCQDEV
jgi:hypothetical protein